MREEDKTQAHRIRRLGAEGPVLDADRGNDPGGGPEGQRTYQLLRHHRQRPTGRNVSVPSRPDPIQMAKPKKSTAQLYVEQIPAGVTDVWLAFAGRAETPEPDGKGSLTMNQQTKSRMWESRLSGSERGRGTTECMEQNIVAPPGNQAETEKTNTFLQHRKSPVYSTKRPDAASRARPQAQSLTGSIRARKTRLRSPNRPCQRRNSLMP